MAGTTRCVYIRSTLDGNWRAEWEGHPESSVSADSRERAISSLVEAGQCGLSKPDIVADVLEIRTRDGGTELSFTMAHLVKEDLLFAAWPEAGLWVARVGPEEVVTARYESGRVLPLGSTLKLVRLHSLSRTRADEFRDFIARALPPGSGR